MLFIKFKYEIRLHMIVSTAKEASVKRFLISKKRDTTDTLTLHRLHELDTTDYYRLLTKKIFRYFQRFE